MSEGHSSGTKWALGMAAILILYPLSMGPTMYFTVKYGSSPNAATWMNTAYAPITLLCRTPLRVPIQAYNQWWIRLAAKDPAVRAMWTW